MSINSPQEALKRILVICTPDFSVAPVPSEVTSLRNAVTAAATAGLSAVPYLTPPTRVGGVGDALEQLRTSASVPGTHYLPAAWVHSLALQGLEFYRQTKPAPTPAQLAADKLLAVALEYEAYLSLDIHADRSPLKALRALLDPLRPLPPVPIAIEELLAQAQAEQMIGTDEADDLRNLARRLAK